MEFKNINIADILPQKSPFVMVDKLLYCDHNTAKTSLSIKKENIFFERGGLSESGLIENIAQTCASRVGNFTLKQDQEKVKIGFIGAIRNHTFSRLPLEGETIITQIDTIAEVFQMSLVNATVSVGCEVISSCEMKITLTDQ